MMHVVVTPHGPESALAARALAERLGCAVVEACALDDEGAVCIEVGERGLRCRARLASGEAALDVDYTQGPFARRIFDPQLRRSPLAKAVGRAKDTTRPLRVLDATLGFARDALMLAAMGHVVHGVERSLPLLALVESGLARGAADKRLARVLANLSVAHDDARAALGGADYDVVYVDPMFPDDGRTAAVKKDLQILRLLVDEVSKNDDLVDLVGAARSRAQRVVVKRPAHARPVLEGVSRVVEAKGMRFDVYAAAPS